MKTTIAKSLLMLAIGGVISAGAAVAQSTSATPTTPAATTNTNSGATNYDPGHPRVNQVDNREVNQQDRIAQGIKSGSLTPHEAAHLERNEAAIQRQKRADMAAHGGHLTKQEQNQLNHEQNRQSRAIYNDKHNNVKR